MELINKLVDIADSIRMKTGKTSSFTLTEMAAEINNIISSPDGTDVAFGSTDYTLSGSYAISSEIMNAIVAEIQKMSGRTNPLTPEEMLYLLRRVVYIPQGYAESNIEIDYSTLATGQLPDVQIGVASSTLNIYFSTSAKGELQEG